MSVNDVNKSVPKSGTGRENVGDEPLMSTEENPEDLVCSTETHGVSSPAPQSSPDSSAHPPADQSTSTPATNYSTDSQPEAPDKGVHRNLHGMSRLYTPPERLYSVDYSNAEAAEEAVSEDLARAESDMLRGEKTGARQAVERAKFGIQQSKQKRAQGEAKIMRAAGYDKTADELEKMSGNIAGLEDYARSLDKDITLEEESGDIQEEVAQLASDDFVTPEMLEGLEDYVTLIETDDGTTELKFTAAFDKLAGKDKLEILGRIHRPAKVAEFRKLADEAPDAGRTYFYTAQAELFEGNQAGFQVNLIKFWNSTKGSQDPEITDLRDKAAVVLKAQALASVDRLETWNEQLTAQRNEGLGSGEWAEQRNRVYVNRLRELIESGEATTLDEAKAIVRAEQESVVEIPAEELEAGSEAWDARRDVARDFVSKAYKDASTTDAKIATVSLNGGTLIDHNSTRQAGVTRVVIGPAGGVIRLGGDDPSLSRNYTFFPSDKKERVIIVGRRQLYAVGDVLRGRDYQDDVGQLDERPRDPQFEKVVELESEEGLERMAAKDERARNEYKFSVADDLRDRRGSYEGAAEIYEGIFADHKGRVREGIPAHDEKRVRSEVEADRAGIRTRIRESLAEQGNSISDAELEERVNAAVEAKIDLKLDKVAYQRMQSEFNDPNSTLSQDSDARRAWESFEDMMDPTDNILSVSDAGWDRIADEAVIAAVTMPIGLGIGNLAAKGVSATRWGRRMMVANEAAKGAGRVVTWEGAKVGAAQAAVRVPLEGFTMGGMHAGMTGTEFHWQDGVHMAAISGIFHVGGAGWRTAARATGIEQAAEQGTTALARGGAKAANLGGELAVDSALTVPVTLTQQNLSGIDSPYTLAEELGANALYVLAFHGASMTGAGGRRRPASEPEPTPSPEPTPRGRDTRAVLQELERLGVVMDPTGRIRADGDLVVVSKADGGARTFRWNGDRLEPVATTPMAATQPTGAKQPESGVDPKPTLAPTLRSRTRGRGTLGTLKELERLGVDMDPQGHLRAEGDFVYVELRGGGSRQFRWNGDRLEPVVAKKEALGATAEPRRVGEAEFVPITEVAAQGEKIAKGVGSRERVLRRRDQILRENPGMKPEEAHRLAKEWIKRVAADARAHQAGRTVIADTSLPAKAKTKHMDAATVDHHGRFANDLNATEQMLDRFESSLEKVRNDPEALAAARKDKAAMRAADGDEVVAAAMRDLNIRTITTDNLADGGWSVWMAKNQARVLKDPDLRNLIREATHFEDFTAFGTEYNRTAPGVRLQAAVFQKYGQILKKHNIIGSDRFTPEQAPQVMGEALAAMDEMLANPTAREEAASEFFNKVDEAVPFAEEHSLMGDASVHQGDTNISFFDLTKLGDFTLFQQWLALPRVQAGSRPDTLQVSVVPMPPAKGADGSSVPRKLHIAAIPNGRELPSGKNMKDVLERINAAERARAEELGVEPNFWFGKENVILPNPQNGGSVLTPAEVSAILRSPELGLFTAPARRVAASTLPPPRRDTMLPPAGEIPAGMTDIPSAPRTPTSSPERMPPSPRIPNIGVPGSERPGALPSTKPPSEIRPAAATTRPPTGQRPTAPPSTVRPMMADRPTAPPSTRRPAAERPTAPPSTRRPAAATTRPPAAERPTAPPSAGATKPPSVGRPMGMPEFAPVQKPMSVSRSGVTNTAQNVDKFMGFYSSRPERLTTAKRFGDVDIPGAKDFHERFSRLDGYRKEAKRIEGITNEAEAAQATRDLEQKMRDSLEDDLWAVDDLAFRSRSERRRLSEEIDAVSDPEKKLELIKQRKEIEELEQQAERAVSLLRAYESGDARVEVNVYSWLDASMMALRHSPYKSIETAFLSARNRAIAAQAPLTIRMQSATGHGLIYEPRFAADPAALAKHVDSENPEKSFRNTPAEDILSFNVVMPARNPETGRIEGRRFVEVRNEAELAQAFEANGWTPDGGLAPAASGDVRGRVVDRTGQDEASRRQYEQMTGMQARRVRQPVPEAYVSGFDTPMEFTNFAANVSGHLRGAGLRIHQPGVDVFVEPGLPTYGERYVKGKKVTDQPLNVTVVVGKEDVPRIQYELRDMAKELERQTGRVVNVEVSEAIPLGHNVTRISIAS